MTFQEVFDKICRELRDDWQIEISVDNSGVCVELYDPNGDKVEFDTNSESIEDEIDDAIAYSQEHDSEYGEDEEN